MKHLVSIDQKWKAMWAIMLTVIFLGCSESIQDEVQEDAFGIDASTELLQQFRMPDYTNIDYQLPKVPDLFDEEEDERSFKAEQLNKGRNRPITVEPGANQLQEIINDARPGTTIVLGAGEHLEETTLVINHRIKLRGEPGAVLSLGGTVGLAVNRACYTSIKNIHFVNAGTAILGVGVEHSLHFEFRGNTMAGFPISVVLEQAHRAKIRNNTIEGVDQNNGLGIVAMNGKGIKVERNRVTGSLFGIWLCDKRGLCTRNVMEYNTFGLILCKVSEGGLPFFSTGNGGSNVSATSWWVRDNESNNNVWGYIAIDGAKRNFLAKNTGSNNAFVDLELAGETTTLFGFPVPGSFYNTVRAGDLRYIDCGEHNKVFGGVEAGLPCSE